ncbi:MAG TPA: hypothetical protein VIK91_05480, partial [Nannocystis sp.]
MRVRVAALTALALWAGQGCAGHEEVSGRVEANPNMPDRVQPVVPPPRTRPEVRDCPEALKEPEDVDRVIGPECKTVTVHPGYRVEGGSLTIAGGVTLVFLPGAELAVGFERPSQLRVEGTQAAPVRFTSSLPNPPPGAWKGVALYEHADGSTIRGLLVEFAGTALRGTIYVQAENVTIEESTIRDSAGVAVHVT